MPIAEALLLLLFLAPIEDTSELRVRMAAQAMGVFVSWSYLDKDLAGEKPVDRFETSVDAADWTGVGLPATSVTVPGGKVYEVQIPVVGGTHTVAVRTCNVDMCSDPLSAKFTIPVPPSDVKIRRK